MKPSELHPVWFETIMLHELFRRMGFSSDDLYVLPARTADPTHALLPKKLRVGDLCIHVMVKAQGLEFTGLVGKVPCADEKIAEEWRTVALSFNQSTEEEREAWERAWDRSRVRARLVGIVADMSAKGFALQRVTKDWSVS